jgi:phosphatidate cytidylyltransferase
VAGEQLAMGASDKTSRRRAAEVPARTVGAAPPASVPAVPAPSAPKTAGERSGALRRRLIAALAIAPPILACVYLGGAWSLLGAAVATFLALREFYALSARRGARLIQPLGFLVAFVLLLANGGRDLVIANMPAIPGSVALEAWLQPDRFAYFARFSVAAAVILPLVALLYERTDMRGRLVGWALTLAGTLYVAWLMSHFLTLRLIGAPGGDAGRGWVFLTFAATWSFDTGAYLVGSRWGRRRFMSWISPNKTWEGAAGGLVACLIAVLVARTELPVIGPTLAAWLGWAPLPVPLWHVPLLALALSFAAQFGDLAESMIKREAGAKDAGELIPGHGGMLDRVDSLLFTVVLVYYYAVLVTPP